MEKYKYIWRFCPLLPKGINMFKWELLSEWKELLLEQWYVGIMGKDDQIICAELWTSLSPANLNMCFILIVVCVVYSRKCSFLSPIIWFVFLKHFIISVSSYSLIWFSCRHSNYESVSSIWYSRAFLSTSFISSEFSFQDIYIYISSFTKMILT